MLDTLRTGTDNEILAALTAASALTDAEVVELCALWKTHEAPGVKKQAKKTLEKFAPGPCAALKAVIKSSLGNEDRKITRKLTALESAGGFPDVAGLAAAISRRTEEHLGLGYLCTVGGAVALDALQAAVTDAGHLDLSFAEVFPDELREIKNLESLELRGCKLKALPPQVLALENLRAIDLSHNPLSPLPDQIRELPHLEKIVLHDVSLSKGIGRGVFDLKELRELWIIRGKMKEIPEDIGRIESLEHLSYIQCDKVKTIPDSVAELRNLKTLVVDWCNLQEVNPVVWGMTGLEHIDFSQSPLDAIPPAIGAMKKLRKLRMLCAGLGELPDEICECTELEDFNIRGQMTRLPEDIGNWKNLKRFSVSFSAVEAVPDSFWSIPGLEYVDFKYSRIPKEEFERARQTWPDAYISD